MHFEQGPEKWHRDSSPLGFPLVLVLRGEEHSENPKNRGESASAPCDISPAGGGCSHADLGGHFTKSFYFVIDVTSCSAP